MGHSDPSEQERLVQYNGFLEIFSSYFIFFAMEIVSAYSKPAYWMRRVILN
jgi:hypothetical protein